MSEAHFYVPRHGHGLPHDPFQAVVAPRPVGWASAADARGRPDLAPCSFFNALCEAPPVVGFASGGKDSRRDAEATGEFVVNLATRRYAEAMDRTAVPLPPGVSAFEAAGAQGCPGAAAEGLEGRPTPGTLVLGQVVGAHITPAFLRGGLFDLVASTSARCGCRGDYPQVTSLFEMLRPIAGEAGAGPRREVGARRSPWRRRGWRPGRAGRADPRRLSEGGGYPRR
jgi:hypothetical protein